MRSSSSIGFAGRRSLLAAGIASVALTSVGALRAQDARPSRIVVPFPPGGTTDIAARLIAEQLSKAFGQAVVVDNKPGANTNLATEFVARSAPDGHTLLMVLPSFVINPAIKPSLPFNPLKDFRALNLVYFVPMVIAVHPSVPARTLEEFVALARAKPGEISYGISGATHQTMGAMLKLAAKINIVEVPYQGGGPALNALLGGHIPALYANVTEVAPHVKTGKLRALVVTSPERADVLPDVPTMREAHFAELEAVNWAGVVVPAATPAPVAARLQAEIARALQSPEVTEKLKAGGMTPAPAGDFSAFLQAEASRYAKVVREAGIKGD